MRAELARHGITARVFCAYKPLVHYFLEEIDSKALVSAQIIYPRHPACAENRFLLEAYPLAALFPDAEIEFEQAAKAGPHHTGHDASAGKGATTPDTHYRDNTYQIGLRYADHDEERSEEHTSELQSLMRISYAVF